MLEVDEQTKEYKYTCLTYVDNIVPQEILWIKDNKITGIAINDFANALTRVDAEHGRSFHRQMVEVRESLEKSVYDTLWVQKEMAHLNL